VRFLGESQARPAVPPVPGPGPGLSRLTAVMAENAAPAGPPPAGADRDGSDQAVSDQDGPEEAGLARVVTVPNLVTAVRLACVPLFLWLLFGDHRQTDAAILLAVLGATDWVDGYVARRFHQVTTLGKVLDPVADRILVGTAVIAVIVHHAVPLWFGVATLAREVLVSAAVVLLAALGAERIDVLWVGKAGTFGLMVSYPIFLVAHGHAGWQSPLEVIAWLCAIPALVLAYIAAGSYIPVARRALAQGRRARQGDAGGPGPSGAGDVGVPGSVAG
jgi:cardiolipin synthase (CMP-forming)